MKNLCELSKRELVSLILNNLRDLPISGNVLSCGCCGDREAQYYYICDKCNDACNDEDEDYVNSKPQLIQVKEDEWVYES